MRSGSLPCAPRPSRKWAPQAALQSYGPNEAEEPHHRCAGEITAGKEARSFEAIDRVKESPEGFLILEHEGEEWKLPEAGLLPHLLQVSTEECRNIFVVRDSDLAVDQEGDFYRDITHRLTGLRSAGLGKIREKLREKGRLTPGLDFQDTAPLIEKQPAQGRAVC